MKKTDTLIIGQGIAGSLVAFMLHKYGIPFIVIDKGPVNSASRVAAGMFTPVSGKRKTIDAAILEQISFAINMYKEIEKLLNRTLLHLQPIYEIPMSCEEQDILSKKVNGAFEKYIIPHSKKIANIKQEFTAFEIINSGWVDCALFINSFNDWLQQNNMLVKEEFNYAALYINNDHLQYHDIVCKNIIFCEGYRAVKNPFFNKENIIPCKGDVLTVAYKNKTDHIIKKDGCYFIPMGNDIFKAGSTYQWNNSDESLDEAGRKIIESKLKAMLEGDYEVTDHQTAIRPTTQNREVIIKQHADHANMYMLNGLGTKGVIKAPWYANELVEQYIKNSVQK